MKGLGFYMVQGLNGRERPQESQPAKSTYFQSAVDKQCLLGGYLESWGGYLEGRGT